MQKFSGRETCIHGNFYKRKLLHTEVFTTQKFYHISFEYRAFTRHKGFYTEVFTQKLLEKGTFIQMGFTQKLQLQNRISAPRPQNTILKH